MDANELTALGLECFRQGDFEEALAHFEQLVVLKPESGDAWYAVGYAMERLENSREALPAFERAIKLNPKLSRAQLGRGNALFEQEGPQEALKAYERALELEADLAQAHLGRGQALMKLHEHARARESCERAIELDPACAGAWFRLGQIYLLTEGPSSDAEGCLFRFYYLADKFEFARRKSDFIRHFERDLDAPLFLLRICEDHEEPLEMEFDYLLKRARWQCTGALELIDHIKNDKHALDLTQKLKLQGLITFYLGDPLLAETIFDEALYETENKNDFLALYYRLNSQLSYLEKSRSDQANALRRARSAAIDPAAQVLDLHYAGMICYDTNHFEQARKCFNRARAFLPSLRMEMLMLDLLERGADHDALQEQLRAQGESLPPADPGPLNLDPNDPDFIRTLMTHAHAIETNETAASRRGL